MPANPPAGVVGSPYAPSPGGVPNLAEQDLPAASALHTGMLDDVLAHGMGAPLGA